VLSDIYLAPVWFEVGVCCAGGVDGTTSGGGCGTLIKPRVQRLCWRQDSPGLLVGAFGSSKVLLRLDLLA